MKMISSPLLFFATLIFLSACASPEPVSDRNRDLTQGNVQMNLRVGETAKSDVLETFGAPNVTTRDGDGREVWTYQRQARVQQSSSRSSGWTVIFAGGSASASGFESTSRMMTLIIYFDENDQVVDFRSRESNF